MKRYYDFDELPKLPEMFIVLEAYATLRGIKPPSKQSWPSSKFEYEDVMIAEVDGMAMNTQIEEVLMYRVAFALTKRTPKWRFFSLQITEARDAFD